MKISYIILSTFLFSLGFAIYKKIAEPISLYVINESIKIKQDEFHNISNENEELITDIEKLQQIKKRKEEIE